MQKVFLHCSASDNTKHDHIDVIRSWHVQGNGWQDVGYHFYVNKLGKIQPGRDLEQIPAAQKGHNSRTIAICLGGLKHFTPAQFKALKKLCQEINHCYAGNISFHGHCEVNPGKSCPVYDYRSILNLNQEGKMPN